ncbi:hypothetical protein H4R18_004619 [Coemansia javaensis]|uniref:Uncharacterized protein n=1 Tax=Coemansia javaensis TaxID=2761396 RepID=A0A9W8H8W9_9FUNG|nr:hypothetical protein H4R18_004619 [Coemansia javaensis]
MQADATNATLGFQAVYVIGTAGGSHGRGSSFEAVAAVLGLRPQYLLADDADLGGRRQHRYRASGAAELAAHARAYADMARRGVQSALILGADVDAELDAGVRLATALGEEPGARGCNLLVLGRTRSDPAEPGADDLEALLLLQQQHQYRQQAAPRDELEMQRRWVRRELLRRAPTAFCSLRPRGVHAYAVSARMARRLRRRVAAGARSLDAALADAAGSAGPCAAYSVSPPLFVPHAPGRDPLFLARSALHAAGLRSDDPARCPPFDDWRAMWAG